MKVLRVHIKGWTASFRYPIFISGFQPTLPVPPLTTIYGILSAAKGKIVFPENFKVGYTFKCTSSFIDLETVYELDENVKAKSNICKREILYEPDLYIYIDNLSFKEYFKCPAYQLLMGRSQYIAYFCEIKEINMEKTTDKVMFGGTIVPFPIESTFGMVQALPTYFTDTIPRHAAGVKPYVLMKDFNIIKLENLYYDEERQIGVYLHG